VLSDGSSTVTRHVRSVIRCLIEKSIKTKKITKTVFLREHILLVGGIYYDMVRVLGCGRRSASGERNGAES
jgi:hypothetical protein